MRVHGNKRTNSQGVRVRRLNRGAVLVVSISICSHVGAIVVEDDEDDILMGCNHRADEEAVALRAGAARAPLMAACKQKS
jgi:hypothetical protein